MQVLGSMCQHMDSMSNGIQNLQAYLISLKIQLKVHLKVQLNSLPIEDSIELKIQLN